MTNTRTEFNYTMCLTNSELIRESRTLPKRGRRLRGQKLEGSDGSPDLLKTGTTEDDLM